MNRRILQFTFSIFLILAITVSLSQWQVYDCSVLPTEADTAWHESNATNLDEETEMLSVIDDPDITGNKLIKVDGNQANLKEMWKYNWRADPAVGATVVFRAKPLDITSYDRDFDLYFKNGQNEERLFSALGARLKLDKASKELMINTTGWHIYRVTEQLDQVDLYIDESDIIFLTGNGATTTDNYFRFGDGSESSTVGGLYDWIIWDVSGAYAPGTGNPLPEGLTGLPTAIEKINTIKPEYFELGQNYPNPFNPITDIQFSLTRTSHISLIIYDINGKKVLNLVNEIRNPGTYKVRWDGCDQYGNLLPSGIYFYSMEAGNYKTVKKMTLLK